MLVPLVDRSARSGRLVLTAGVGLGAHGSASLYARVCARTDGGEGLLAASRNVGRAAPVVLATAVSVSA